MSEVGEKIDIKKYDFYTFENYSEITKDQIRKENISRLKKGSEVWNAWADALLKAIEQTYPSDATTATKLAIRDNYIICFSGGDFGSLTDLSIFHFYTITNFVNCRFSQELHCNDTTFDCRVDFDSAKFEKPVIFDAVEFKHTVNFSNATFLSSVSFCKSTFNGNVYFDNSSFLSDELKYTFFKDVVFEDVVFERTAHFYYVTFSSNVSFRNVRFAGQVEFVRSIFEKILSFKNSHSEKRFVFSQSTFKESAWFDKSTFKSVISFREACFHKVLSFAGCYFSPIPLDIRDTIFEQVPLIDNLPSDASAIGTLDKSITRSFNFFQEAETKFRLLKQVAEQNHNHQKMLEFYACELYCRRKSSHGLLNPKNWASYAYQILSRCGLSLARPFVLWFLVLFLGVCSQSYCDNKTISVFITWRNIELTVPEFTRNNIERLVYYASPSLPSFVIDPIYKKEVRHRLYPSQDTTKPSGILPSLNRAIRLLQTLVSFVALFLFGLALRNRFKIG